MRKIILDTDIGNDVDDIFALIMLARLPNFKLLGVTTVYGDTVIQTRMARYVLNLLGRTDVPCFIGESTPYQGGTIRRGSHVTGGFPIDFHKTRATKSHSNAVDFLIEQSKLHDKELEIIAIGPLTNIGKAIEKDPQFASRIKHLTLMGGLFDSSNPRLLDKINDMPGEYNIICDLDAAKKVCEAKIPSTFIPLDVTTTAYFTNTEKQLFSRLPFGLGDILEKELEIWWNLQRGWDPQMEDSNHPHDPIAVVSLYKPELFTFQKGNVSIGTIAERDGMTLCNNNDTGISRIATKINISAVTKEIVHAIVARV